MAPSSIDTTASAEPSLHSPGSPSTAMSSPASSSDPIHTPVQQASSLDDIFGSSPPLSPANGSNPHSSLPTPSHVEPSDLPALRRQHVTAGYRDGVSSAKNEYVQHGFDAGFPVGAELGIRVGVILGVLEGMVNCAPVAKQDKDSSAATTATATATATATGLDGIDDVRALYKSAKSELEVQKVFGAAAREDLEDHGKDGDRPDPCVRLGEVGEEAVSRWEDKVRLLLEERS